MHDHYQIRKGKSASISGKEPFASCLSIILFNLKRFLAPRVGTFSVFCCIIFFPLFHHFVFLSVGTTIWVTHRLSTKFSRCPDRSDGRTLVWFYRGPWFISWSGHVIFPTCTYNFYFLFICNWVNKKFKSQPSAGKVIITFLGLTRPNFGTPSRGEHNGKPCPLLWNAPGPDETSYLMESLGATVKSCCIVARHCASTHCSPYMETLW